MAHPPDKSLSDMATSCKSSIMPPIPNTVNDTTQTKNCDAATSAMRACDTATSGFASRTMTLGNPVPVTSAEKITSATSYDSKAAPSDASASTSSASEKKAVATEAAPSTSLFSKLPGELRNRLYRHCFDALQGTCYTFRPGKCHGVEELALSSFNLLQTDRMIRSEAGSIFNQEYLADDRFTSGSYIIVATSVLYRHIGGKAPLAPIRDKHMRIQTQFTIKSQRKGYYKAAHVGFSIARHIARATGQQVLTHWQRFSSDRYIQLHKLRPNKTPVSFLAQYDHDCMYECRIGTDFLIKYRAEFDQQGDESCLYIEGPLAEISWEASE